MKIRDFKIGWIYILASLYGFTTSAQISSDRLQQYLSENVDKKGSGINYLKEIRDFYAHVNYQAVWIQQKDSTNLDYLLKNLSSASNWKLREKDYQFSFISVFKKGSFSFQNLEDSIKAEILFSDAAIHFYNDIAYGNTVPVLDYNGIEYIRDCMDVPKVISEFILKNKSDLLVSFLSPPFSEIKLIENKINWILQVMNKNDFKEISIISKRLDLENRPL